MSVVLLPGLFSHNHSEDEFVHSGNYLETQCCQVKSKPVISKCSIHMYMTLETFQS